MLKFFATCPKGLESLLFSELQQLNCKAVKETVAGVAFSGDLTTAMRVCLHSRLASRVLYELVTFNCEDDSDLYLGAHGVAYEQYFSADKTIAVTFNGSNKAIRNTQYGALRVKDAICDHFVARSLPRPNVERHHPDVHIVATLRKGECTVSLDLSGQAQFWRNYHRTTGVAPLKENLAAAIVLRSGFTGQENFVDPMCGSGTLLLEAAAIATDLAPGLQRENFGFFHLNFFTNPTPASELSPLPEAELVAPSSDAADSADIAAAALCGEQVWAQLKAAAQAKFAAGLERVKDAGVQFRGCDSDDYVLGLARDNIEHAGLSELISVSTCKLTDFTNPCTNDLPCVVVTNPPYGERMGNFNELIALYTTLGQKLRTCFSAGTAAVISSSPELLSCLRLSRDKSYRLFNGALECQLRVFTLRGGSEDVRAPQGDTTEQAPAQGAQATTTPSGASTAGLEAEVLPFANRLRKNLKHLSKWARREEISAFRVYDADLPDYNAAIDRYNEYYVIQEYQAPASIKPHVAQRRLLNMIAATIDVTGAAGNQVIVKSRERQKGESQYEKREDATGIFMTIYEGQAKFEVNLYDYLDTGIFLDARPLRRLLSQLCAGKSFLNLFAYTCTATVMAALGGATRTKSVDMSHTYLEWGQRNLKLNGIDLQACNELGQLRHSLEQADCLAYLSTAHGDERFDVIYIDPPTFSNSKRMERSFEVQRDHVQLLGNLTRHLEDQGVVVFCTNKRNFTLAAEEVAAFGFSVENITAQTFDPDFKRDPQLHTCFKLTYNRAQQVKEPEALVSNTQQPRWSRQLQEKGSTAFSLDELEEATASQEALAFPEERRERIDTHGGERASRRNFAAGERQQGGKRRLDVGGERRDHGQNQGQARGSGRSARDEHRPRSERSSSAERAPRAERIPRGGRNLRSNERQPNKSRTVRVWGPQGVKEIK